jgi:GTP 3',8-cyclase
MTQDLIDASGRVIDYLRISITDLCNLRCVYCRPPEGVALIPHDEILRYEEILKIVSVAGNLGIRKVRVTGGEPLVRRGVLDFLSRLTSMEGIEDVGLTTNGVLLMDMARGLKAAGLKRINISLDTLRRDVFKKITGGDRLEAVMRGIRACLEEGFDPVKINVVLLAGINEEDLSEFARLTIDLPVDVRFIERMPFAADEIPGSPKSLSSGDAVRIIEKAAGKLFQEERGPLDGPARMYRLPRAKGRIGIIDPVTGHFCGICNRMRLTARGTLRPCLLSRSEIDIKTPLRQGAGLDELAGIIRSAVAAKPARSCHGGVGRSDTMNTIGG